MSEIKKAEAEGFSVQLMLLKGLKTFLLAVAMLVAPVVIEAITNGELIKASLQGAGLPAAVVVTLTALIVAGGKMVANWWTHRNGPK